MQGDVGGLLAPATFPFQIPGATGLRLTWLDCETNMVTLSGKVLGNKGGGLCPP